MPFFSVIIPLYNKEHFIEKTLRSVLNQTFTDFEVLIINDGSTDNSTVVLEHITDPRIQLYHTKNQGVSHARNYGISKGNSEYIAFLDADDLWQNTHLENLHQLSVDFPEAQIYCTAYNIQFSKTSFKKLNFYNIDKQYRGYIDNFFEASRLDPVLHTGNNAIQADVFGKNVCFDTHMRSGQDTDLWISLALKYKIAIDNNSETYTYIKNNISLSKSPLVKDRILLFAKYKSFEKKNVDFKRYMDQNRYSVALNYKENRKNTTSKLLYKKIDPNNLNLKQKVIFHSPFIVTRLIRYVKDFLDKKGVFLHLYQ